MTLQLLLCSMEESKNVGIFSILGELILMLMSLGDKRSICYHYKPVFCATVFTLNKCQNDKIVIFGRAVSLRELTCL